MDNKVFKVIECKDCIYIKEDTKNYYDNIGNLLFDGQPATKTYKDKWYRLDYVPKKVEQKQPDKTINVRYELKAGYPVSDVMPAIINKDSLCDSEFEEVSGLYERKYDVEPGGYEEMPFEIDTIYKKDDFEWVKTRYQGNPSLILQIEVHPDILQEFPQSLSSEQMYGIIRDYVKANINNLVAHISSDYDFHFEVQRKILIAEPYSYDVNTNAAIKRRKPNWVKKWVNSKSETVLNLKRRPGDSSYGTSCQLAPAMYGLNSLDLENKVNEYLQNLMTEINREYQECPHCKGWGVIEVKKDEKDIQ